MKASRTLSPLFAAALTAAVIFGPSPGCSADSRAQGSPATDPESAARPGAPKQLAIFFEVSNRGELDPCG